MCPLFGVGLFIVAEFCGLPTRDIGHWPGIFSPRYLLALGEVAQLVQLELVHVGKALSDVVSNVQNFSHALLLSALC